MGWADERERMGDGCWGLGRDWLIGFETYGLNVFAFGGFGRHDGDGWSGGKKMDRLSVRLWLFVCPGVDINGRIFTRRWD